MMRQYVAEGERERAIAVAAMAAPYVHPRLAAAIVKTDHPSVLNIEIVTINSKRSDVPPPAEVVPVDIEAVVGNGQQDGPADNHLPSSVGRWLS
jgi:hypothetical protein